jgi:RNA polymerase sigma factor (sigma-70 family)
MATSPLNMVIERILADFGPDGGGMTDGELLARFLSNRDDNAIAALVRRHAPMVWGVCCRLVRNHHDAEDAFQATFLVLVRKAAVVPRLAVANWLHGVARQTAVRLRATTAKRGRREKQVVIMPEPTAVEMRDADLRSVLDEELSRLPNHYRSVIVPCDLEGMTRREAARQLGIPEGSVASRLARARMLLAKRLTRRGIVFSGGSFSAVLSAWAASASAPPALVASTIKVVSLLAAGRAACAVSARVSALTEGVVNAMLVTRIKGVLTTVLVIGLALGGVGLGVCLSTDPAAVAQAKQIPANEERPVPPPTEVARLIGQLGDEDFEAREAATARLMRAGESALPALHEALASNDPEVRSRATKIIAAMKAEKLRVLIDQVLAAHGGEDRLNKLQFTMTIKHSNGETQHYFVQPPRKLRWETTHRDRTGKRIVILFPEGRRWWTKEPNADPREFIPTGLELPMAAQLDRVKFFGPRQVLRLRDADHRVSLLDEEARIGDRAAVGVEVVGPHFNQRMYFDKETYLLVKQGAVTFSDYKTFDGILIAQREHDGYFEPEITDFRAVDKFDAKLFEQP